MKRCTHQSREAIMDKKLKMLWLAILMLIISLSSCEKNHLSIDNIEGLYLPPLGKIVPILQDKADEIKPGSSLQRLMIELFPNKDESEQVILARFQTDITGEIVYIYYFDDGTVSGEIENIPGISSYREGGITPLSGIEIDSSILEPEEALSIMLDYVQIDPSYSDRINCSGLVLGRVESMEPNIMIWDLILEDCEGDFFRQVEINAQTGELLGMK